MIDLNAEGEPCETLDDLADFVRELFLADAITPLDLAGMLAEITEGK